MKPMRITHIRAKQFLNLREVDLELRPFSVLIGPNGAGKSTLLDLLHRFQGIDNADLFPSYFSQWGGYEATLFYGAANKVMQLGFSAGNTDVRLDYDIEFLGEGPQGCYVRSETLIKTMLEGGQKEVLLRRQDSSVSLRPNKDVEVQISQIGHNSELSLIGERHSFSHLPEVQGIFTATKNTTLWSVYKFQPTNQVRGPQQLQPAKVPSADGNNLLSVLYYLKTERRDVYRSLVECLQLAVPELEELDFPVAGAGYIYLTWKQRNYARTFDPNQLSDGTLRLLWLFTVLFTVPENGLVLIDEPELSLHPQWLQLVVSMLRKTSARTTVMVATQSAELIKWVEPNELLIADIDADEGGTKLTWADKHENIDAWLKDFTLSELWTMGELGGRR